MRIYNYSKHLAVVLIFTFTIALTFVSCSSGSKERSAETEEHEEEEHTEGLELNLAQMKAVDIVIGKVERKKIKWPIGCTATK